MDETKPKLKPPTTMPDTPEGLLAFVAYPEYYENETETEFNERRQLCVKLAEQYVEYLEVIKHMDSSIKELNKPKIWIPNKK